MGIGVPHNENVPLDEDALYYLLVLNGELSYELRASWGGMFRVALGGWLRMAENMADLCDGVPQGRDEALNHCNPPHYPSASHIAGVPGFPYFRLGLGWAF